MTPDIPFTSQAPALESLETPVQPLPQLLAHIFPYLGLQPSGIDSFWAVENLATIFEELALPIKGYRRNVRFDRVNERGFPIEEWLYLSALEIDGVLYGPQGGVGWEGIFHAERIVAVKYEEREFFAGALQACHWDEAKPARRQHPSNPPPESYYTIVHDALARTLDDNTGPAPARMLRTRI